MANKQSDAGRPGRQDRESLLRGFRKAIQIGVVVRDIEKSMCELTALFGIGPFRVVDCPAPGRENQQFRDCKPVRFRTRQAFADLGSVELELIQPMEGPTLWGDHLAERGPGIHPYPLTPRQAKLFFRMGLSGQDEALRVLLPGETVRTPAVHVGLFQADGDRIVQETHDHVRSTVLPAPVPGRHVEIEANHHGYLCDRENEPDLKRERPQWLLCRDGQPINGRALDFTNPEVVRWAESEVERIIRQYGLDLYRIDHNHTLTPAGNRRFQGYTEDLTWRYYENLYAMFDRLRAKFPSVVFQNCSRGGGRLDRGTLGRFHNTELSDWMRMPRGLRILNGVTMSLPPEILLRSFGTEVGEHDLDGDLDAQLRVACLCRPIFRGIAPGIGELTPWLKARIDHALGLYRELIRPLLTESRVFHHTPLLPVFDASPWCVLEYASQDGSRAVAGLFRLSADGPDEFLLKPRGLRRDRYYQVTLDNTGGLLSMSGAELAGHGIPVRLSNTMASELILFSEGSK